MAMPPRRTRRYCLSFLPLLWFTGFCLAQSQTEIVPSQQAAVGDQASGTRTTPSQTQECVLLKGKSAQLLAKEEYVVAVGVLEQAYSACPDKAAILLKLSRSQMLSHQFEAAQTSIDKLLPMDPSNAAAFITAGELAYLMDKDSKAEEAFQQAIRLSPKSPEPHYLLGRLYFQTSAVQKAQEQFLAALALDATWFKAYDGLGLCYAAKGDTPAAISAYMKGVSLIYKDHPPQGDVLYADFAELLLRLGSNQKAFDLAAEAADRNPRAPRNYFLAGKALEQAGALSRSLVWLKQSAAMDPNYPDPHYLLARVYRRLGQKDAARQEDQIFEDLMAKAPAIRR